MFVCCPDSCFGLVGWVAEERVVEERCSVSPLLPVFFVCECVCFFTRSAQAAFARLCQFRPVFRCLGARAWVWVCWFWHVRRRQVSP